VCGRTLLSAAFASILPLTPGHLTKITDGSPQGNWTFGYDHMGRLTSSTVNYTFDNYGAYTIQYGYDAASNRTSMTDPQGQITNYVYDSLNRLSSLSANSQTFGFNYDALSRRTQLTRPNGVNTNYAYDNLSRLLSVLHQVGVTTLDGEVYTYDSAGNRLSKADQLAGITSNFAYDPLYQLNGVTQGTTTTESYTYDAVGNRLSSLGLSPYQYNSSNELTSTPTTTYTYDKNGELKTKVDSTGTTTYTWDTTYRNLLTSIALPGTGGTVSFRYDPFGRRIQKSGPAGTTNYLYDGSDIRANVIEAVDNSGNVLARYTQGPGTDQPLAELRSGTTSYYELDGLGSVSSLSNSAATLANTYTYDSFGKVIGSTGSLVNPFQYTGRESDPETGLNYYRFRYYDPNSGRFLSEDPITFEGGIDFYSYVRNHPSDYVDPFGLARRLPGPPGGRSGFPPPPVPNPIPNPIASAYAAYKQCTGPNPWKGCSIDSPHFPTTPPPPNFDDPFGNGALPPQQTISNNDVAIINVCGCLRQNPLAILDPHFNGVSWNVCFSYE
jgi:RHS repeat-associated protein